MIDSVGYKSLIDLGREARVYHPHSLYDYPTKILPQVMRDFIERFSNEMDCVLDPFAGGGATAVECALRRRRSVNIDINPYAIEIAIKKLDAIRVGNLFDRAPLVDEQLCLLGDARSIPLLSESVDAVITDIPYADMVRYSDLPSDLSTIADYDDFLSELSKAFDEIVRVLKVGRYCVIFVADYRIARSRLILPLHADVIGLMQERGLDLFDLYIWRYYRSSPFRPFGAKPYQSMNTHTYVLVFHKPASHSPLIKNRPIRYRNRLAQKLERVKKENEKKSL
ncbi:MAG: hypothetical protein KatS3mg087_1550 [Patescibacteria group bacterium]|nr:MAG: hypothetical protein KatS3mg087_1550 [Patescibacteria group bacterium]